MITPENYYSKIKGIDFSTLPEVFQKGHAYVNRTTFDGQNWSFYQESEKIKKVVDDYFKKLGEHLNIADDRPKQVPEKTTEKRVVKKAEANPLRVIKHNAGNPDQKVTYVERIPEELRFIKRFVLLNGKTKTKEQLLGFINGLQRAIVEKRIRKTSKWAKQIKYIQEKLVETYNAMKNSIHIELKPETLEKLKKLAQSEKLLNSIMAIKRYISLNGKPGKKEKAETFLKQLSRSLEKGTISENDAYFSEVIQIKKALENFVADSRQKVLDIQPATLNGLNGILGSTEKNCGCNGLEGLGNAPTGIMNSMDFADMKFERLGFTGKWLAFIGDPAKRFTAMVFGRPKMGKSYLCVELAGYLARNFGKVLYVAREEKLDATLQDKLNDTKVKHSNLFVSDDLPEDLSPYRFVFLDSVNKLGLSPVDLEGLKTAFPQTSFIHVFQTTKEGNFRGANAFQHDVDVVIEVPELGRAVQFGRFNQGGEMEIFRQAA